MTEEELRALIGHGEDQRTELKAAEADSADIARAITALANSDGGTLLLGVDDDGSLLGLWYAQPPHIARTIRTLPDLSAWRQFVVNVSRHNCEPAVPIGMKHVGAEAGLMRSARDRSHSAPHDTDLLGHGGKSGLQRTHVRTK